MSIRTYQANYSDQSSWRASALGTLLRDFDTGMGAMRRPVAKPISSRGPRRAHAYTQLGEFPLAAARRPTVDWLW